MCRRLLPLLAIVGLLASCSTQKAKWANVQYHNTSCHFNVWWNGNESLKAGVLKLEKAHADDYTQILPVYKLGTKEQAMSVYGDMDRAVEKGVKGITKHSIYVQGREHVPYVKKCYLLTAYATFYKKDYAATTNTCNLIISQYPGTAEGDEARILLARTKTMQRMYGEAEADLDKLATEESAGNISPRLVDKLYMAMVECLLPQEKYKKAVQYLRLALDETSDHYVKARLYFIMAQIYQTLDKRPTAAKYYEKVLGCRPDYVMEFNARINMASCSDVSHTNVTERERDLNRMLKDKKNEEFKDQIYYAMGDLYLGVKDVQKACDNYKLSVQAAANNPAQKAKSALKMADVLYDIYENYDLAQRYYDTAMRVINRDYPHYDEIRDRHSLLTSLVEFTRLINLNDSLIAMADMDPEERSAMLAKKIDELKKHDEEERERKMLEDLKKDAQAMTNTLEGDWYFYNRTNVDQGKETFRSRWGTRLLEDYWFLSKKGSLGMGNLIAFNDEADEDEGEADDTVADSAKVVTPLTDEGNPDDPYSIAFYTKDLPQTQGRRDSMNADIAEALLNAGYIYYDGIENTERALECYLRLANDYPENESIEQAFYQLFRIYAKQGNTPSSNYYRDMVLMGFPDGDYANMIRDDEYYLEIIRRSELVKEDYASIYSLYRRKRYTDVLLRTQQAMQTYPNDKAMMGRFQYWNAMALAQTGSRDSAIEGFRNIMATNPDTSQIYLLAQNQLAYFLDSATAPAPNNAESITEEEEAKARESRYKRPAKVEGADEELPVRSQVYRYRENMPHWVIVIINDKKIVATQLQYRLSDFNSASYANMGYRCSAPLLFTDSLQMITIHQFNNAQEALDYQTHLLLPEGPLAQFDRADYQVFTISKQNYTTFYNRKDIEAYRLFFEKYYR